MDQQIDKGTFPQHHKHNHKVLIVGLLLMLLIVTLVSVYIKTSKKFSSKDEFQPISPAPTMGQTTKTWKKFQAPDDTTGVGIAGFTFEYPKEWEASSDGVGFYPDKKNRPYHEVTMFYYSDPFDTNKSLSVGTILHYPAGDAHISSYTVGTDGAFKTALFTYDGFIYTFTLYTEPSEQKQYEPIFEHLLNSLTFNSPIKHRDLTHWHTYSDKQAGFSFQYPQDWQERNDHFTPDPPCPGCGGVERGLYYYATDSAHLSARAYAEKDTAGYGARFLEPQPAYIAHMDAVVMDGFMGAGAPGIKAYIKNKDKLLIISFDGIGDNTSHTILSTVSLMP